MSTYSAASDAEESRRRRIQPGWTAAASGRVRAGAPRGREKGETMIARILRLWAIAFLLGGVDFASAADSEWTVELAPVYMQAYGHDPHVLTIHEVDSGPAARVDTKTPVALETDDTFAYRGRFQVHRERWTWGVDFLWFVTTQNAGDRAAAAGGALDEVAFEVADRAFVSSAPEEVLYYRVLEDTDLEMWTVDLYGLRTLASTPDGAWRLQLGLRLGDFDNDYHAVVGIQDVAGSRLDASSNYDRMMGPLVGLQGETRFGKHSLAGYLGQSVLFGTAEKLAGLSREFTGPFSETPAFFAHESFRRDEVDVAIPISELRLDWRYQLSRRISVGAGVETSVWWDVPVPPGLEPTSGGDQVFSENTIVLAGVLGSVKYTF